VRARAFLPASCKGKRISVNKPTLDAARMIWASFSPQQLKKPFIFYATLYQLYMALGKRRKKVN